MTCPNCGERLREMDYNSQTVAHCANCGGSFFEENGINRLSLTSAVDLASQKVEDMISATPKFCPRDHAALLPASQEAVPSSVMLLQCPSCKGVFAYPDDLVAFKRAQNAKVQYFKLWSKPMVSVKSIAVLAFFFAFSVSVYVGFYAIGTRSAKPIQAEDVVQKVNTFTSGRHLIISFRTTTPHRSQAVIYDKTLGTKTIKDIAVEPQTFHYIIISDLVLNDEIYYQIAVSDNFGRKAVTTEKKL